MLFLCQISTTHQLAGACPGGGAQGAWAPPLEFWKEKLQKKKKKKVIRANIKLFHLYLCYLCLVENVLFHQLVNLSWAPPPLIIRNKLKLHRKKKKAFRFSGGGAKTPLSATFSWTRAWLESSICRPNF